MMIEYKGSIQSNKGKEELGNAKTEHTHRKIRNELGEDMSRTSRSNNKDYEFSKPGTHTKLTIVKNGQPGIPRNQTQRQMKFKEQYKR